MSAKYIVTKLLSSNLDKLIDDMSTVDTAKITQVMQFNDSSIIFTVVKNANEKTLDDLDIAVEALGETYKVNSIDPGLLGFVSRKIDANIGALE